MKLTRDGWTVRDHLFGKSKPPSPKMEKVFAYLVGCLVVFVIFVVVIAVIKLIWRLV